MRKFFGRTPGHSRLKRFFAFGILNTVITYAIFIALGLFIHPSIAHAIAFLVGVIGAASLSGKFVFRYRGHNHLPKSGLYLLVLSITFVIAQLVISSIDPLGFGGLVLTAGLLALIVSTANFCAGALLFREKKSDCDLNPHVGG